MKNIIHIVENLDKGAVENWLVRMFCYGQKAGLELNWTFYCVLGQPGRLDDIVTKYGGKIIFSPVPLSDKVNFLRCLRKTLRKNKYDVLHCHHDFLSALYFIAASGLHIPKKIVHVHNADEHIPVGSKWKQNLLRPIFHRICLMASDCIVGISNHTLDQFLRNKKRKKGKHLIHYYGVDVGPFLRAKTNKEEFLHDLQLPKDSLLVLFVGRMAPIKNPVFAVEVLEKLQKIEPKAAGIFVGAGGLLDDAKERARVLKVNNIRFLGWRDDIPSIMSVSDLFISPHVESPMEGLGLVLVEAQLAGLPLLISQGIAPDPIFAETQFKQFRLQEATTLWAQGAQELMHGSRPNKDQVLQRYQTSSFSMKSAMADLLNLHN